MINTHTFFSDSELNYIAKYFEIRIKDIKDDNDIIIGNKQDIDLYEKEKDRIISKFEYKENIPIFKNIKLETYLDKCKIRNFNLYINNLSINIDIAILDVNNKIYKGIPEFSDELKGSDFYWFGCRKVASSYAQTYQGGLLCFRIIKRLKLLLLNSRTLQLIYNSIPDSEYKIKQAFDLKFCVSGNYLKQIRNILKFHPGWNNEIWFYNRLSVENYGDIIPDKMLIFGSGRNDRIVFSYLNKILKENNLDGIFSPMYFTPYIPVTYEEFVLSYPTNKLVLDVNDDLYWKKWVSLINIKINPDFRLSMSYRHLNNNFKVLKYYSKHSKPLKKEKNNYFNICTYNVKYFDCPNALFSKDNCFQSFVNFIKKTRYDIYSFQEFPERYLFYLDMTFYDEYEIIFTLNGGYIENDLRDNLYLVVMIKKNINFVYEIIKFTTKKFRNSIYVLLCDNNVSIMATHIENTPKLVDNTGGFVCFDNFMKIKEYSYNIKKKQLDILLSKNPDIILGDLNIMHNSYEFSLIEKSNFISNDFSKDIEYTNLHLTITDYLLVNKKFNMYKKFVRKIIDFPMSDHLPVVLSMI